MGTPARVVVLPADTAKLRVESLSCLIRLLIRWWLSSLRLASATPAASNARATKNTRHFGS